MIVLSIAAAIIPDEVTVSPTAQKVQFDEDQPIENGIAWREMVSLAKEALGSILGRVTLPYSDTNTSLLAVSHSVFCQHSSNNFRGVHFQGEARNAQWTVISSL